MDFSQYNKINSRAPGNFTQQQQRQQHFVPQVQSFPNSVTSKYPGQQIGGNSQFQNQSASFFSSNMMMKQQQPSLQMVGDDVSRNFISNITPLYNTQAYS